MLEVIILKGKSRQHTRQLFITWYISAMSGTLSASAQQKLMLGNSDRRAAKVGAKRRQGPHHSTKKNRASGVLSAFDAAKAECRFSRLSRRGTCEKINVTAFIF